MAVRHVEAGMTGLGGPQYLAELKPIIAAAAEVRGEWMLLLSRLKLASDPNLLRQEAVQIGIDRSQRFRELRRRLTTLRVPPEMVEMHRSVDGWLSAMAASCDALVQHAGRIGPEVLETVRDRLRNAARQAERFNAERKALANSGAEEPGEGGSRGRLKSIGLVAVVLLIVVVGGYFAWGAFGPTSAPPVAKPGLGTPGAERRVFPQAEVLGRLKQEVTGRSVAFQDSDIQLEPPDRIVITGKAPGPLGPLLAVTIELQISASDDGKPKLTPLKISAAGVTVPQAVTDALSRRADEANRELAGQIPAGQLVKRIFVENNSVVAELEGTAPAATGPGATTGQPAAKP